MAAAPQWTVRSRRSGAPFPFVNTHQLSMNSVRFLYAGALLALSSCSLAAPPPRANAPAIKMPMLSPEAARAGEKLGGEGAQWPRWDIAVSPADPNFLLLPIDVGGLYASRDGGATWNLAMNGWNARGANNFAIDPRNAAHVLGVASNSMEWDKNWGQSPNGVYLSTDKAGSWTQVLSARNGWGGFTAFDPSSFDAKAGMCLRAYYLSEGQGLFRSDDGGKTWQNVAPQIVRHLDSDWTQGGGTFALVRVERNGAVLISGQEGLFRSTDKGRTFEHIYNKGVYGFDIASDGALVISGDDKVLRSTDSHTFVVLPCVGLNNLGKAVRNVKVSPADPKRMMCWVAGDNWKWVRYWSHDGGATWKPILMEVSLLPLGNMNFNLAPTDTVANAFPVNARQGYVTWHPTDPNVAWSIGGDFATKSTDGGKRFRWSNAGYNGIMIGVSFNFNLQNPNEVLLGFQDYNGAFTLDGGRTWTYRDLSGLGWGGQCYGAGASGQTMWYGDSGSSWNPPRKMRVSRDGGTTWNFVNDAKGAPLLWGGDEISYTDPKNPAILFASNLRSTDQGATWQAMSDCQGVYISMPDGALLGKKGTALVRSRDDGATWQRVVEVPGGFGDVACDARTGYYFFASEERVKMWDGTTFSDAKLPLDQYGRPPRVVTVAVDPGQPRIVYAGGPRNIYASAATLVRSRDGGATWENLTTGDGPHETSWIRVHPKTGDAWLNGQCYGMWRIPRPRTLGAADPAHRDAPRAALPGTVLP